MEEVTTSHGLVIIVVARGISADKLAVNKSEKEFWLTGEDQIMKFHVTQDSREVEDMLESIAPKMAIRDVAKLTQSNRWVALLTGVPRRKGNILIPDQG